MNNRLNQKRRILGREAIMTREMRLAIGLATIAPVGLLAMAIAGLIGSAVQIAILPGAAGYLSLAASLALWFVASGASCLVRLYYGFVIAANDAVPARSRGIWMALFLVAGGTAAIVYWLLYIWPADQNSSISART